MGETCRFLTSAVTESGLQIFRRRVFTSLNEVFK